MTDYLSETRIASGQLDLGEHLDLAFRPKSPGTVTAVVRAQSVRDPQTGKFRPSERQVALYKPGSDEPVVSKTDDGQSPTQVETTVSRADLDASGTWTLRASNLEADTDFGGLWFSLTVTFPGGVEVETVSKPVSEVLPALNDGFRRVTVYITSGREQSYVEYPVVETGPDGKPILKTEKDTFTVPDMRESILWFRVIRERVADLRSEKTFVSGLRDVNARHPNGSMNVRIEFEGEGTEVLGTFQGEMGGGRNIAIEFGIWPWRGTVSYATVDVNASFAVNWLGISNELEAVVRALHDYNRRIERTIEDKTRELLLEPNTKAKLSESITFALKRELKIPAEAYVHAVRIKDGELVVQYAPANG